MGIMIPRILASLILFVSIFYMPFWLSVVLALASMIYFSFFWESVTLFFISDLIYGVGGDKFLNVFFISFIISIIVLLIIEMIKKKIRVLN
jgi:hypothetical protein